MTKEKPTQQSKDYIRYWHPRKGGWYHARLIRLGRKWALVKDLAGSLRQHRIPVADVREAVL
jgi:hypothetical protein